jgi:diadenosine tetraphosphate (Ap4A) HIT family hydrolase
MPTAIHRKIEAVKNGKLPSYIARLPSGIVVAGDVQPLQGYCILMADPVLRDFNALSEEARAQYGRDLGRVGDALLAVAGAYRINYETWGNLDPALHTHIVPRFLQEPDDKRILPPRQAYDWSSGRAFDLHVDGAWMKKVAEYLKPFSMPS